MFTTVRIEKNAQKPINLLQNRATPAKTPTSVQMDTAPSNQELTIYPLTDNSSNKYHLKADEG